MEFTGMNNPEANEVKRSEQNSWRWGANDPIPDSHELHMAFWESFRHPEVLLQRYDAGEDVGVIARSYGRSCDSLKSFFDARFGSDWRARDAERIKSRLRPRASITVGEVVARIKKGDRQVDLAIEFGVPAYVIQGKLRTYRRRNNADA